jgi:protein TonB
MTALAMPFGSARRDNVRWGICLAVVIAAHLSIALTLLLERPQELDFGIDEPVVMLDLPPGPKQEESEETPPPEEETKPPETEAEVALPEPPKPEPPKEQKLASSPPPVAVVRNWESLLVAHIERFKRYPLEAREHGEQGMVRVAFAIDRDGWVRSSRIVQSSGSSDLDQEALAMLVRAQPVPRPPERIPTRELSFQVPIKFTIR